MALAVALCLPVAAQQTAKVTLENSESLFSLLTAINSCGYDQALRDSLPVRAEVRRELAAVIAASPQAQEAHADLCGFYRDHHVDDATRDLAQYVSLGLSLGAPPTFATTVPEADLPPDALYVFGIAPRLQRFYTAAGLHNLWTRHQAEYQAQIERFHEPLANMLLATDVYLKMPISGYLGRRFVVYVEPMAAPGQVNARQYGVDYFMVVSPEAGSLPMEAIRHTYLHYVLDPMSLKRAETFRRLSPLLSSVETAPMDESYKKDITLLVTESLIRAVETRMLPGGKNAESRRELAVQQHMREGFVLTEYFYGALKDFEKSPTGMRDSYGDLLHAINVGAVQKRLSQISFARQASPDPLRALRREVQPLDAAEQALVLGNAAEAERLAQDAIQRKAGDPGRAYFILARAATLAGNMEAAQNYFQQTLASDKDPKRLAWSHIYLGRLFDIKEERDAALEHYRAALAAGDVAPETKAAAERGLKEPYEPPQKR